jgi:hypothetical protein
VPDSIRLDLQNFVAAFPVDSPVWKDLAKSLRVDMGAVAPEPRELIATLEDYFSLDRTY